MSLKFESSQNLQKNSPYFVCSHEKMAESIKSILRTKNMEKRYKSLIDCKTFYQNYFKMMVAD